MDQWTEVGLRETGLLEEVCYASHINIKEKIFAWKWLL